MANIYIFRLKVLSVISSLFVFCSQIFRRFWQVFSPFPGKVENSMGLGLEYRPTLRPYVCMYLEISCMKPISVPPDLIPGGK